MATVEQTFSRHLDCPVCYERLTSPKLLACGHTFCINCLVEIQSVRRSHIVLPCPVCRHETRVAGDVSQLPVNVHVQALLDELANTQPKCPYHEPEEGLHLCSDVCLTCKKAICRRCRMLNQHENHNVLSNTQYNTSKAEEIRTIDEISTSIIKTLEEHSRYIEERSKYAISHIDEEIRKVNTNYDDAVRKLTERRDSMRRQLEGDKILTKQTFQAMTRETDMQIAQITNVTERARNSLKAPLEGDTIAIQNSLFDDVKIELGKDLPKQKRGDVDDLQRRAISAQFTPYRGKNELNLGILQRVEWTVEQTKLCKEDSMSAMAATYDGDVAVGLSEGQVGFYTRKGKLRTSKRALNVVRAIGILPDGRYLVCDCNNTISIFQAHGEKDGVTFQTLRMDNGGFCNITVDSDDRIYVSYRKASKILVFTTAGGKAIKEIPCDGYTPIQLFACKFSKDLVVKSHSNSVRVIDQSGGMKRDVTKEAHTYDAYPAVCWDDSIIIAWVRYKAGIVSIDHYTSDLDHIRTLIKDQRIDIPQREWFYIQEFKSGDIAFCTVDKLYTFQKLMSEKDIGGPSAHRPMSCGVRPT